MKQRQTPGLCTVSHLDAVLCVPSEIIDARGLLSLIVEAEATPGVRCDPAAVRAGAVAAPAPPDLTVSNA